MLKKINYKRILLLLLSGFFFACFNYLDAKKLNNKELQSLNRQYKIVDAKQLLNILDTSKGILIVVNDKNDINDILNKLLKITDEHIYIYNSKNDEPNLELINNQVKVINTPTEAYNELLNKLDVYADNIVLESHEVIITDYKKINTPNVLMFNEGKILFSYCNEDIYTTEEEIIDLYKMGLTLLDK